MISNTLENKLDSGIRHFQIKLQTHREEYFSNILPSTLKLDKILGQTNVNESNKKFEGKLSIHLLGKNQ